MAKLTVDNTDKTPKNTTRKTVRTLPTLSRTTQPGDKAEPTTVNKEEVKFIPEGYEFRRVMIDKLVPARTEWHQYFSEPNENKILELAESILKNDLLQPIVVRKIVGEDRYEILAGHTRVKAYNLLYNQTKLDKYLSINAFAYINKELSDEQALEIFLDTNFFQRGNLPPKDYARCIKAKADLVRANRSRPKEVNVADVVSKTYNMQRTSFFKWEKIADLEDEYFRFADENDITGTSLYKLASLNKEDRDYIFGNYKKYINNSSISALDKELSLDENVDLLIASVEKPMSTVRTTVERTKLKGRTPIVILADRKKLEEIMAQLASMDGVEIVSKKAQKSKKK